MIRGVLRPRARRLQIARQYDKVRGDYEKAMELAPDNAYFHYSLAEFWYLSDVARQISNRPCCTQVRALAPAESRFQICPGHRVWKFGTKGQGRRRNARAAELCGPGGADRLARACSFAGDLKGAVEWSKKALALGADNPTRISVSASST